MSNLLKDDGQIDRAKVLLHFYNKSFEYKDSGDNYDPDFIDFIIAVKGLYGGMGSVFDTYIGDHTSPDFRNPQSTMYKNSEKFDRLTDELYEECVYLRTKKYIKKKEDLN